MEVSVEGSKLRGAIKPVVGVRKRGPKVSAITESGRQMRSDRGAEGKKGPQKKKSRTNNCNGRKMPIARHDRPRDSSIHLERTPARVTREGSRDVPSKIETISKVIKWWIQRQEPGVRFTIRKRGSSLFRASATVSLGGVNLSFGRFSGRAKRRAPCRPSRETTTRLPSGDDS